MRTRTTSAVRTPTLPRPSRQFFRCMFLSTQSRGGRAVWGVRGRGTHSFKLPLSTWHGRWSCHIDADLPSPSGNCDPCFPVARSVRKNLAFFPTNTFRFAFSLFPIAAQRNTAHAHPRRPRQFHLSPGTPSRTIARELRGSRAAFRWGRRQASPDSYPGRSRYVRWAGSAGEPLTARSGLSCASAAAMYVQFAREKGDAA